MKILIASLLFSTFSHATKIQTYSVSEGLKTYTAAADIALIYDLEKDQFVNAYKEMREKNIQDIKNFEKLKFKSKSAAVDLDVVFKKLIDNPVAGLHPVQAYNDASNTGFCFGRALFVQKELERQGVNLSHIRKVFILGELFDGHILWDYHVATMYIDPKGHKWMIDSLFNQVYEFDLWFQKMNQYALNKKEPVFRIYFAEADKFQARSGFYGSAEAWNPIYNQYFFDLIPWL